MQQLNSHQFRRKVIFSVLFTIFLDFLSLGLVYPLFSVACLGEGAFLGSHVSWMSQSVVYGLLLAAFPLGQFFGAPLLGQSSDRYGRKPLLALSLIGSVLTLAISGLGIHLKSLGILLMARFLGGVMAGNMTIAYAALTDLGSGENKVRNFSLVPLATGLGFTVGPYMASVLADSSRHPLFGLSTPFYVAALLALLNFGLVQLFFPETRQDRISGSRLSPLSGLTRLLQGLGSPTVRQPLLVLFLLISANLSFVQFLSVFAVSRFGMDISGLGILYTNTGLSVALGHTLLTRTLASRFSIGSILPKSLLALALMLTLLGFSQSLLSLHALTTAVMLGCSVAYSNAMAHVSNSASDQEQGEVMGMAVSIQCVAECLPPLILGWTASADARLPILLSSLMAASAWWLYRASLQTQKALCPASKDVAGQTV